MRRAAGAAEDGDKALGRERRRTVSGEGQRGATERLTASSDPAAAEDSRDAPNPDSPPLHAAGIFSLLRPPCRRWELLGHLSISARSSQEMQNNIGADSRVVDVLREWNVPIVQVDGYEADDVVATLTQQVLQKGYRVVIGSPDKDFKQLISEDVQLVMPIPEIGRWSFYTLRHYVAQYKCDPTADLSLRCFMGDEADGVPGIQHLAPGFGRKTAVKLLNKHGSLENLLKTAAIRTVGKEYAQDILVKHADYLRKNYEVLSLRRDVNVQLDEIWLSTRDTCNDNSVLSNFILKFNEGRS